MEPATQLVSQKYWVNNIWVPNILGPIGSSSKSKSNCSVEPATQLVSDKDMDGSLVFCGSLGEVTRHPVSRLQIALLCLFYLSVDKWNTKMKIS